LTRAQETQVSLRKQLARALLDHHEWVAASQPLLELVRATPKDSEIHVMLGTVYREQGLYEEGLAEYQRALDLDSRSAEAYDARGILREVRGDVGDESLADFQRAISLDPHRAAYYNNLGFALYLRGRTLDAVKAFRESLREDPSVRRAHNNLGFAYGQLGHYGRAKAEFQRGGSEAVAENNLGVTLEQNKSKDACEHFQAAAALDEKLDAARANADRTCSHNPPVAGATPP
jgi:Flp pilus assembly protein TadD